MVVARRKLLVYMWSVVALAVPLVVLTTVQAISGDHVGAAISDHGLAIGLFCIVLVIGELCPIPVARGREAGDEITVSSTFGFALLLIAPVFVVLAAQAVALGIDVIVRDRERSRLPFNVAQYALAFMGARLVYSLLTDQPFSPGSSFSSPNLPAALAAATVFLVINNCLVAAPWRSVSSCGGIGFS